MTRKRRLLGLSGILVLAVVVAVVVTSAGIFPLGQILDQQDDVALATRQLEALQEENRRLEAQIAALETPEEVERLAREQFGLVMPGEQSYVVVSPDGEELPAAEPLPLPEPETAPWWQRLWDFLSGRDLVQDE